MKFALTIICLAGFILYPSGTTAQERIQIEYRNPEEAEFDDYNIEEPIMEEMIESISSRNRAYRYSEDLQGSCMTNNHGTPINISQVYAKADSLGQLLQLGSRDELRLEDCLITVRKNGAWRMFYLDGTAVVDQEFSTLYNMKNGNRFIAAIERKFGVLDPFAPKSICVPFVYDDIIGLGSHFVTGGHPGIFKVRREMRYGIIDSTGNMIMPLNYKELSMAGTYPEISSNTQFKVRTEEGEGVIDYTGKVLIPITYQSLEHFNEKGIAIARTQDGYGLINRQNEVIVPFQYKHLDNVNDTLYFAKNSERLQGVINLNGEIVVPFSYDVLRSPDKLGGMRAKKGDTYGLVSLATGQAITPFNYDGIDKDGGITYVVTKDGKQGMINGAGKIIFPCIYAEVEKDYGEIKAKVNADDPWFSRYEIEDDGAIAKSTLVAGNARDQAFEALRDGNYERSRTFYLHAIKAETDVQRVKEDYRKLIETLVAIDKPDSAKLVLKQLIAKDVNDPITYLTSARLHNYLKETELARSALQRIDAMADADLKSYEQVSDPKYLRQDVHNAYGSIAMTDSSFTEAIKRFDAAITIDDSRLVAFYLRAECHNELGNFDAAKSDIDIAIDRYEKAARFFLIRANALIGIHERENTIVEGCTPAICNDLRKYFEFARQEADTEEAKLLQERYCATCN